MAGRRTTPPLFELLQTEPDRQMPGSVSRSSTGVKSEPAPDEPAEAVGGGEDAPAKRSGLLTKLGKGGGPSITEPKPVKPASDKQEVAEKPEPAPQPNADPEQRGGAKAAKLPAPKAVKIPPAGAQPRAEAQPAAKPKPTTGTRSGQEPARQGGTASAPRPEASASPEKDGSGMRQVGAAVFEDGHFSAPVSYLYLGLAVFLLAVVVSWSAAYSIGYSAREREISQAFGPDQTQDETPRINEPLTNDDPTAPPRSTGIIDRTVEEPARQPEQAREEPAGATRPATARIGPEDVLTASGPAATDPRQGGLNYLVLVGNSNGLEQDEALALVEFMAVGGVNVVAIPIDGTARGANNPPRYRIVGDLGIPGGAFTARRDERERYQARAQELGGRWLAQGGSTRFDGPLWMKYSP